jgi:hypothetical protein
MKLPIPNSVGLPSINSYIYVEWNEAESNEPSGWYHCQVINYLSNGKAILRYKDDSTETVDLRNYKWELTRKNGKAYLPPKESPPIFPLKKARQEANQLKFTNSSSQSVKAYADDLTLISTTRPDHQAALHSIDNSCIDLGLEIRPDKCVSFCYDGEKPLPCTTFTLNARSTRNISSGPTKFLGETIGLTPTLTKRFASKKLTKKYTIPSQPSTPDQSKGNSKYGSTNPTWYHQSSSTLQSTKSPPVRS